MGNQKICMIYHCIRNHRITGIQCNVNRLHILIEATCLQSAIIPVQRIGQRIVFLDNMQNVSTAHTHTSLPYGNGSNEKLSSKRTRNSLISSMIVSKS